MLFRSECETLDQVAEAVAAGADRVMVDNMDPAGVRAAVELVAGRAEVEVSGGITLATIAEYAATGADFVSVKRGGDITYHGPGQLVGYPILNIDNRIGASQHVCQVEQLVIDTLTELGVAGAGRLPGYAGVWLDAGTDRARKISAIGVRLANGRTMHGFALNIDPDMTYMREIGRAHV